MPGDQVAERGGVTRNLLAELGAGVVEHFFEGGEPRRQHVLHGVAARRHGVDELLDAVAQRVGDVAAARDHGLGDAVAGLVELLHHLAAARNQRLGDAIAGLFKLLGDVAAAQVEVEDQRLAGRLERGIDLVGAGRDRLGELARRVDDRLGEFAGAHGDQIGDLLGAPHHQVDDAERSFGKVFGDLIEPRRHQLFEAVDDFGEILADMIGLEIQVRGELVARRGDGARGVLARGLQPGQHVAAAARELLDHVVADLGQRQRDVLALFGQRMGNALRSLVDLLADQIADRRQILGQIDVDVVDGGPHLLGLADQRVALVGEILQEPADAHFIVAIGALERRHLVLDQYFEFAGARQGALDAVAHGRDLAADRLSDGDDGIACHAFRFGQPHGDLGHRLGDQAQFLGAPGHMGDAEEKDDRQQRRGAETDHDGSRRVVGTKRGIEFRTDVAFRDRARQPTTQTAENAAAAE